MTEDGQHLFRFLIHTARQSKYDGAPTESTYRPAEEWDQDKRTLPRDILPYRRVDSCDIALPLNSHINRQKFSRFSATYLQDSTMSVSAFSVAHDFEVQAYNRQRAAYIADQKARKREEKALKEAAKRDRRIMLNRLKEIEKDSGRHWTRMFRSSESEKKVPFGKTFEDDDDSGSDEIPLKSALANVTVRYLAAISTMFRRWCVFRSRGRSSPSFNTD